MLRKTEESMVESLEYLLAITKSLLLRVERIEKKIGYAYPREVESDAETTPPVKL